MLRFDLKILGAEKLKFNLLNAPLRDWRDFWPQVSRQLSQWLANRFASEGARGPAGAWAPLSPDYAARKARKYPGAPVLQASRRLWESLVPESGDTIDERWPDRMRWGTSLPYVLFHQTGTSKMPARPIFDFRVPDDRRAIQRQAISFLQTAFRKRGFRIAKEAGVTVDVSQARVIGAQAYESDLGAVL